MADIYVSALATGGGAGTIGAPFTLAEAIVSINAGTNPGNGETCWVKDDGTYNTEGFTITSAGQWDLYKSIQGYSVTPGDAGIATILVNGGTAAYIFYITAQYWFGKNIIVDGNNNLYGTTALVRMHINDSYCINMMARKGKGSGFIATKAFNCTAQDNLVVGFSENIVSYCYAFNNTVRGFDLCHSYCCIGKSNTAMNYRIEGSTARSCISDGPSGTGHGFYMSRGGAVINCIAMNHSGTGSAIYFAYPASVKYSNIVEGLILFNNNVHSNALGAIVSYEIKDPGFTDAANNDYTRLNANLDGTGFQQIGQVGTLTPTDYKIPSGLGGAYIPTLTGAENIRLGTNRGDGVIGTLDLPPVNDVQEGVTFDGATKTGVFVSPAEGNVKNGITYGASAEFTGSYNEDYPTVNNVRDGIVYGNLSYEGTLELPLQANVKNGITYGAGGTEFTGIYVPDYPSISNVRTGTVYAESTLTGTLDIPSESDVRLGILYGAGGTEYTGSLDLPAESNVRLGTQFDNLTKTGTVVLPATTNVRLSSQYGSGGTEYTGGLDLPAETNVRDGIKYDSETKEGSLELPDVSDVRLGVVYGASGTELTGELIVGITVREDMVLNFNNDPVKIFLEVK